LVNQPIPFGLARIVARLSSPDPSASLGEGQEVVI